MRHILRWCESQRGIVDRRLGRGGDSGAGRGSRANVDSLRDDVTDGADRLFTLSRLGLLDGLGLLSLRGLLGLVGFSGLASLLGLGRSGGFLLVPDTNRGAEAAAELGHGGFFVLLLLLGDRS